MLPTHSGPNGQIIQGMGGAIDRACAEIRAADIASMFSRAKQKALFDVAHGKFGSVEAVQRALREYRLRRSGEGWWIKAAGTRFHVMVAVHALRLTRAEIAADAVPLQMAAE